MCHVHRRTSYPQWTTNTLSPKLLSHLHRRASYHDVPHTPKSHYIDGPITSNSLHAVPGTSVPSALRAPGTDARAVLCAWAGIQCLLRLLRWASYPDVTRPSNGQLHRWTTNTLSQKFRWSTYTEKPLHRCRDQLPRFLDLLYQEPLSRARSARPR